MRDEFLLQIYALHLLVFVNNEVRSAYILGWNKAKYEKTFGALSRHKLGKKKRKEGRQVRSGANWCCWKEEDDSNGKRQLYDHG